MSRSEFTPTTGNIEYTPYFIRMDAELICANTAYKFIGEEGIRRLISILIHLRNETGCTIVGQNKYFDHTRDSINPDDFKAMNDRLEQAGYITQRKPVGRGKKTYTTLLKTPIYDAENDRHIPYDPYPWSTYLMRANKAHYIIIPKSCALGLMRMSSSKASMMIKLYRYNSMAAFEGIDVNAMHVRTDGTLYLHDRLLHETLCSQDEAEAYINELVTDGLLLLIPKRVFTEKLGFFSRLRIDHTAASEESVLQLVPKYQRIREAEDVDRTTDERRDAS